MIKNDQELLLKSNTPIDHHILTPLVSFILLCASFEATLIHSLETLTLTDIDQVSNMKYIVSPTKEKVESPAMVIQNVLAYMGVEPRQIPILSV